MTADERALIAAVCANPDDDLPRLVYADWLDENGQPERAEFVRGSVRLHDFATSGRENYWEEPEYRELTDRLDKLASAHESEWMSPLWHIPRVEWPGRSFRANGYEGGFACYAVFPNAKAFTDHAAEVFSLTPVRYLRFGRLTPRTAPKVLGSPLLRGVKNLDLGFLIEGTIGQLNAPQNEIGPGGAAALAANPHAARLESLRLSGSRIGDDGLRALAAAADAGRFPRLIDLELDGNGLTAAGVGALAGSKLLAGLRRLELGGNQFGEDGVRALAAAPVPAGLRGLYMGGATIGDGGARVLAEAGLAGNLVQVNLNYNEITDEGAAALAASPNLSRLNSLYLDGNSITPAGAERLAEWSRRTNPVHHYVSLTKNPIPEAEWPRLKSLFRHIVTFR